MLRSLCAKPRLFSQGLVRAPGRIFGSQENTELEQESGPASGSAARSGTIGGPQFQLAFPEEANQDYDLNAFEGHNLGPLPIETVSVLSEPLADELIEIKPDGSCYLPEVQYRRILNKAFGIAGWSVIPRGPHTLNGNVLSREYALFANGRFISQARGHTAITGAFQNPALCTEAVRSNALMRCCKDLGIAASLWDASIINQWKARWALKKTVTDYQGRSKMVWEKKRLEQ
jgi:hypothetical protein